MSAAAAAVGAMARRQRNAVAAFTAAGATSAARACTPEALGFGGEQRVLRQLRDRDVIRMESPNHYWVDLVAWESFRRRRRRLALVLALVGMTIGLVAALLPATVLR